ncbi:MAG: hypothetical protein ACREPG_06430, partial [Candidatus Binatia bacterium]
VTGPHLHFAVYLNTVAVDPRWMGLYKKTTEPGLKAMDIPYRIVSRPEDIVRTIKDCNESARAWLKPVAVLLNEEALW